MLGCLWPQRPETWGDRGDRGDRRGDRGQRQGRQIGDSLLRARRRCVYGGRHGGAARKLLTRCCVKVADIDSVNYFGGPTTTTCSAHTSPPYGGNGGHDERDHYCARPPHPRRIIYTSLKHVYVRTRPTSMSMRPIRQLTDCSLHAGSTPRQGT